MGSGRHGRKRRPRKRKRSNRFSWLYVIWAAALLLLGSLAAEKSLPYLPDTGWKGLFPGIWTDMETSSGSSGDGRGPAEDDSGPAGTGASQTGGSQKLAEGSFQTYQILNDNQPGFTKRQKKSRKAFESYSKLDALGRCGPAFANICKELMPREERQPIGHIRPSGWHTVKYPEIIDGNYLYNRCHLIGYQLAGENDNERNLITGTRHLNVEGMLPFENAVAEYVRASGNHVLYRVTPIFSGENLVADGVEMEAYSVEDKGKGVCFHVFVYNEQPGILIDYATGDSTIEGKDG